MTYSSHDKDLHHNLIINIILNSEILEAFPLQLGVSQKYFLGSSLFNTVWEVLANAILYQIEMSNSKKKRKFWFS